MVLASGEIVDANAESNPDLWRALKGGSNNFGVVTSFRLQAHPQGKFFGGFIGPDISSIEQQFEAFAAFTGNPDYDPYAALIYNVGWNSTTGVWACTHNLEYTGTVNVTADGVVETPAVFRDIASLPQTFNTTRISNLTDFTVEMAAGGIESNRRALLATATYKNSAAMMSAIYEIAQEITQPLSSIPSMLL